MMYDDEARKRRGKRKETKYRGIRYAKPMTSAACPVTGGLWLSERGNRESNRGFGACMWLQPNASRPKPWFMGG